MIVTRILVDAWSLLVRGERLDVYEGPVDPPREVLDAVSEEYARHQESSEMVAVSEVPADFYLRPIKATAYEKTADVVVADESWMLVRLARESARDGVSPWEAARTVFGCPPVRRGAEWRVVCRVRR